MVERVWVVIGRVVGVDICVRVNDVVGTSIIIIILFAGSCRNDRWEKVAREYSADVADICFCVLRNLPQE